MELFDLSFNSVSIIEPEAWPGSLVNFYVAGNGIKELDVRKIPASLEILDVGGMDVSIGFNAGKSFMNYIEDLEVTAMAHWSKLKILDVAYNHIDRVEEKNIPVPCIAFFAAQNRIRAFRTARLTCLNLQILDLSNNMHIETFDSTRLPPALRILNLYNNSLKHFDTSNLPELKTPWLGKNQLRSFVIATLPTTLKILSLTHIELTAFDFKGLPRGLDVLNVNHNKVDKLPVSDLPECLQQLEIKRNKIALFDWQEVADSLKCLMSITFEKNDFLKDVDKTKALSMFSCILQCPNLFLKPHEYLSYLQNFSEKYPPENVVGNDA